MSWRDGCVGAIVDRCRRDADDEAAVSLAAHLVASSAGDHPHLETVGTGARGDDRRFVDSGVVHSVAWTSRRPPTGGRAYGNGRGRPRTSTRSPRSTPQSAVPGARAPRARARRRRSAGVPRSGSSARRTPSSAGSGSRSSAVTAPPSSGGRAGPRRARPLTMAGVTILRFDADGLVVDHRDYWNQSERREPPFDGW